MLKDQIAGILLMSLVFLGFGEDAFALPAAQQDKMGAFYSRADTFFGSFNYDSAAIFYDSAMAIAIKSGEEVYVAYLMMKKGKALLKMNMYDSSGITLTRARKLGQEIGQDSIVALADIELGWVYTKKQMPDSAGYYYHNALDVYEKLSDSIGMGVAMHNLSSYYRSIPDFEKSLEYALKSNRILKNSNKKLLLCRSLLSLGNIYHNIRDYDTALSCFEMCKSLSDDLGNSRLMIKASINKGATYLSQGKNKLAKDELLSALEICKEVNYFNDLCHAEKNRRYAAAKKFIAKIGKLTYQQI